MKKDNDNVFSKWLVVSDIDGTLNNKFRFMPRRNYNAIKSFTEKGGNFALASSRAKVSLERNYKRLPDNSTPAIVMTGSGIYDFKKQEWLWYNEIGKTGKDLVRSIYYRFPFVEIEIFTKDVVYILREGLFSSLQVYGDRLPHKYCRSIEEVPDGEWGKVIFLTLPVFCGKLLNRSREEGGRKLYFTRTSPISFEMIERGSGKGHAVRKLAEIMGVDMCNTAAIGDYYNDEDMLCSVALPAACGQAPKYIKSIAKYQACHCNKGAVGDFLEYIEDNLQRQGGIKLDAQLKKSLQVTACKVRMGVIEGTFNAKSGHPGGSLSIADILTYLYFAEMHVDPKDPASPERDRFVLSKGHTAPALYSALALKGFFPFEEIKTLRKSDSRLQGHPSMKMTPGVDMSTGSLGQGISTAVGMALGGKHDGSSYRVYTVLGDGELGEGQVWEAAMFAAAKKLDNLVAVIDNNNLQIDGTLEEVNSVYPIAEKFVAFGWNVIEIDGHDFDQIDAAFKAAKECKGKPTAIVAKTIKGKGVSFMEDQCSWHGTAPNAEQYETAMGELKAALAELEA